MSLLSLIPASKIDFRKKGICTLETLVSLKTRAQPHYRKSETQTHSSFSFANFLSVFVTCDINGSAPFLVTDVLNSEVAPSLTAEMNFT